MREDRRIVEQLGSAGYDLPARDKVPVIQELMQAEGDGLHHLSRFGDRPTVCVDFDAANLCYFRERLREVPGAPRPLCVVAEATALPFKPGAFRFVLCGEVLEHIEDDQSATRLRGCWPPTVASW